MTLNMDDDLDMSMRAPYISMNESSELPLLIAEDLMWGAQPDLKESLNIKKNEKLEIPILLEQQQPPQPQTTESSNKASYQNGVGKNSMDSSLASLLCSQLLQQQLLNQQQQQQNQTEEQTQHIMINKNPEFKIKILDNLIDTNDHIQADRDTKNGKFNFTFTKK